MRMAVDIVAALVVFLSLSWIHAEETDTLFDPPRILQAGSEPLNEDGKIMYPSPAIFDIDNDGQNELVLGSIFGGVYFCENESSDPSTPQWSRPATVKTVGGQPLQLHNW